MIGIISFLLGYLLLLIGWVIINLVFYGLSVLFKKAFVAVPYFLNSLLVFVVQVYLAFYPLYLLWQFIKSGEWLIIILFIVFGSFLIGFWRMIYGLLIAPISLITAYFAGQASKVIDSDESEFEYEYISPEGRSLGKVKSSGLVKKETAIWFLIGYGLTFFYHLFNPYNWGGVWVLVSPFLFMVLTITVISVLRIVLRFLRGRKVLNEDRGDFISKSLKIYGIIYLGLLFLELML